ncbi:MAG: hypothetical protein MMC23_001792 [Stictis urceolatum]|nr:hypothetical protein [Stictis urceolata]
MATTISSPSDNGIISKTFRTTLHDSVPVPSLQAYASEPPLQQQEDALQVFANTEDNNQVEVFPTTSAKDGDVGRLSHDRKLVVSPYTSDAHLLDLNSVSLPCQLLAKALTTMKAVREDYATASYLESFNWSSIIQELRRLLQAEESFRWRQEESFYIVVFRSQIPPTTDRSHLGALDEQSHAEAMEGGGLLKYWFGIPDITGRNLATCIWRDFGDSKRGSVGRGHKQATKETRALYTEWGIDRLNLRIGLDAQTWNIVRWTD